MTSKPAQVKNRQDVENYALINDLLMKKDRIGQLEKENMQLAGEYLKAREKGKEGRPLAVLEQMVKDKNEVI